MGRRKTIQEKEVEVLMTKHLDEIGRLIIVESSRNSKVSKIQKDHLRDSGNFRVKPYNVLTVTQYQYGKWNTPKGKATPADRSNIKDTPLLNSIQENVNEGVKVLIKDMLDLLTAPVQLKK